MQRRLHEYFSSLSEKDLVLHSVESIGMYVAEHEQSRNGTSTPFAEMPEAALTWLQKAGSSVAAMSRRTQPLLRALLEELNQNGPQVLRVDEMRLLLAVYGLLQKCPHQSEGRLAAYIAPHASGLRERYFDLLNTEDAEGIPARLTIVTTRDLTSAPARDITRFAGIRLPSRGPIFRAPGPLKIIGNVPDQCMVVVENSSVIVEGYVLGKVAAVGDCDIQENIAGVVVVREGDIRARNIVDHAMAVAKRGAIRVQKILRPKLVFAGNGVSVAENITMGTVIARTVQCTGEIRGGLYHITESCQASFFRADEARPVDIVCRNKLTCEDYGEELGADSKRALARAARLQNRIREYEETARVLGKEAEDAARTALYFLSGQRDNDRAVEELERDQRRLAALNRTIMGVHMLSEQAEENLYRLTQPPGQQSKPLREILQKATKFKEEPQKPGPSQQSPLDRLAAELTKLLREFADPDISTGHGSGDKLRAKRVLDEARLRLHDWIEERNAVRARVTEAQTAMETAHAEWERVQRISGNTSNIEKLQAILQILEGADPKNPLVARARSPFVALMQRTIVGRSKRAVECRDRTFQLYKELSEVMEELRTQFQIELNAREASVSRGTRIAGKFEAGVRIVTESYLLDEEDPPPGSAIVTTDGANRERVYIRSKDGYLYEMDEAEKAEEDAAANEY